MSQKLTLKNIQFCRVDEIVFKAVHCPQCDSQNLYRDGLRELSNGSAVQRWLCRDCGYRFSQTNCNDSTISQRVSRVDRQRLNRASAYSSNRQVCELLTEGLKNLIEVPRQEQAQREGTTQTPDIKGKIVEYLWHLKREGRKEHTIISHRKVLSRLAKHGANLLDPESVKDVIANEQVQVNSKYHYVNVYTVFAEWLNLPWKPPIYKSIRKIPWIPSEGELDQLIAGFKRKTVVYLMILKETMARSGEIWALKWTDLNGNVLAINAPEKNSNSRQFKLSDRLVSLLNSLAKKDQRIFGPATNLNNFRGNFSKRRKYLATKLGNPRLNQITFHTFRHWGATMLYHKTKDILYVKQQLGHRCIENTMVYTQLISFENDEFHTSFARTLEEEDKLLKAGFEFVRYSDKEEVAIYRKRK